MAPKFGEMFWRISIVVGNEARKSFRTSFIIGVIKIIFCPVRFYG
jgi:hypothetical protein